MSDQGRSCTACAVVAGELRPVGGIVWRGAGFTVHAPAEASPIAGWLVVTSDSHVRGLEDLGDDDLAALGPVAARVVRAQRAALGAGHVHAFSFGEAVRHFHLHLVPCLADTPAHLRGTACFAARPGDALPAWRIVAAVEAVRRALRA